MADDKSTGLGIACGVGAGALWGLVFLAPQLVRTFTPLEISIGRYLCFGLLSALLIAPRAQRLLPSLGAREWRVLIGLAFAGNLLYYVLLSSAVQLGGIAMASLVIGFMPVTVTIVGSRERHALPLRRLAPSLLLCAAATVCIGWQSLAMPASGSIATQLLGLACAVGALASWTAFAVVNSRCLLRLQRISVHDWNLLVGLVTGVQALLLVPLAVVLHRQGHAVTEWLYFLGVTAGLAMLASIVGNALWNRASRLLPLTLVGQMIVFETLFAMAYGLAWEGRMPSPLEAVAFVLVVAGVTSCVSAHRSATATRPAPP